MLDNAVLHNVLPEVVLYKVTRGDKQQTFAFVISVLEIYVLSWFLDSFSNQESSQHGLVYGLSYALLNAVILVATQGILHHSMVVGLKMGAALSYVVYKKVPNCIAFPQGILNSFPTVPLSTSH